VSFRGRGKLGPHLTQCRLGRSLPLYQVASNRLATIHQRYKQDRQDNGPIGRTVLQRSPQTPVQDHPQQKPMGTKRLLLLLGGIVHLTREVRRRMASSRSSRAFGSKSPATTSSVSIAAGNNRSYAGARAAKWMPMHQSAASLYTIHRHPNTCKYTLLVLLLLILMPDRRRLNRLIIGLNWPKRMGFGRDAASEVGRQRGTCVAGSTRRACGTNARDSLAHSPVIEQN